MRIRVIYRTAEPIPLLHAEAGDFIALNLADPDLPCAVIHPVDMNVVPALLEHMDQLDIIRVDPPVSLLDAGEVLRRELSGRRQSSRP